MKKIFYVCLIIALLLFCIGAKAIQPIAVEWTPELLAKIAGIVLSLLFSYFPKLNTWYAAKTKEFKTVFMLLLLVIISFAVYILTCYTGLIAIAEMECGTNGFWQLMSIAWSTVTANQIIYLISPQTKAVKEAKISG